MAFSTASSAVGNSPCVGQEIPRRCFRFNSPLVIGKGTIRDMGIPMPPAGAAVESSALGMCGGLQSWPGLGMGLGMGLGQGTFISGVSQ